MGVLSRIERGSSIGKPDGGVNVTHGAIPGSCAAKPAIRFISITSPPFLTLRHRPDVDLGHKPVFLAPGQDDDEQDPEDTLWTGSKRSKGSHD